MEDLWPLFRLRLRTGELELRYPDDADLDALGRLAAGGIHDPAEMPFSFPFTDAAPLEVARSTLQFNWRLRGEWQPSNWHLTLVVVEGGQVVGTQGMAARGFAVRASVSTGSWLGRAHQGRGIGTAMRQAVLHLAFAGLGAAEARSGAFVDNTASVRVSERVGYEPDGTERAARRGHPATQVRFVMTRARWEACRGGWPPVRIEGLDPCLALFGAQPDASSAASSASKLA